MKYRQQSPLARLPQAGMAQYAPGMPSTNNLLFYGDNLDVLRRHIPKESVDLVYLDPPFNSNASYNVLFASRDGTQAAAQIQAFEDTWHWDEAAARHYEETVETGGARPRGGKIVHWVNLDVTGWPGTVPICPRCVTAGTPERPRESGGGARHPRSIPTTTSAASLARDGRSLIRRSASVRGRAPAGT
jgi:hypothetical protein